MTARLTGRHAVVTGAGRGIGRAIAHALAREGARVSLAGRGRAALEQVAREIAPSGDAAIAALNVADAQQVRAGFDALRERAGRVDILVNNAGSVTSTTFLRTSAALWNEMLAVNLTGTFHCTQAVLGDMVAAGSGRIVNVASTAGLRGYGYVAAYCAAKHGVVGLTRALALEVATKGVTVNAVCPGYTDTDIVRDAVTQIRTATGRSEREAMATLTAANPQGRLVTPEEVAAAVVWLCLPEASAVNGHALPISGGETN